MNRTEFMAVLNTTEPMKFFSLATNKKISPYESNIINELLSLGLPHGVVNAIIDYSLRKNSGRLVQSYIVKLGNTAKKKGFENAESEYGFLIPKKAKEKDPLTPEERFEAAWMLLHIPKRLFGIQYGDLTEEEKQVYDKFDFSFTKQPTPEETLELDNFYKSVEKRLLEKLQKEEEEKKQFARKEFLNGNENWSNW